MKNKIINAEEFFLADESETFSSGLSLDEISENYDESLENSEANEFLKDLNLGLCKIENQGEDFFILSHPKYKHNVEVSLIPDGASDTFVLSIIKKEKD